VLNFYACLYIDRLKNPQKAYAESYLDYLLGKRSDPECSPSLKPWEAAEIRETLQQMVVGG
jgi:hypothetical protein